MPTLVVGDFFFSLFFVNSCFATNFEIGLTVTNSVTGAYTQNTQIPNCSTNGGYNIYYYNSPYPSTSTGGYLGGGYDQVCNVFNSYSPANTSWSQTNNAQWYMFKYGGNNYYAQLTYNNGVWTAGNVADYSTHIISFTPENGTTTGNLVNFSLEAYINSLDNTGSNSVVLTLNNINQNNLANFSGNYLASMFDSGQIIFSSSSISNGMFSFSTSTYLADGNYAVMAKIGQTYYGFTNPFSSIADTIFHKFIVNQGTFIGNFSQTAWEDLGTYASGTNATTTQVLADSCTPWSGAFGIRSCMLYLLYPDSGLLNDSLTNFKDNIATHFPLGYINETYDILSTTTTIALPSLSIPIPSGMPAAGSSINLDIFGNLMGAGSILSNATSSYGSSTGLTLYDVTHTAWETIIWTLVGIYILGRILKLQNLMPKFGSNPNETIPYSREYNSKFYDSKANLANRKLLEKASKKYFK